MLNLIFCVDNSGLFGRNNGLPWYFKEDLKYFKDITTGNENYSLVQLNENNCTNNFIEKNKNIIVMGYNTWSSLKYKLPNRINVVISANYSKNENLLKNNPNMNSESATKGLTDYIFKSFDEFLCKCKKNNIFYNKKIFIIGGKKLLSFVIYRYYKYINNIFATIINHSFPQFLNDTIFKLSSFICLDLSKQTTNVMYCTNYNDNKLYSLNFIYYTNKTFNLFEVNNFINDINNNSVSHYNYSLLNEMVDINIENINIQKCKECGDEIENISNNDKIDLCNKCIYSKCRCIFC